MPARRADLLDDPGGIAQRVQGRPALDPLRLEGLEGDPQVEPFGLGDDLAQAADRGVLLAGAGEAEERGGLEGGETVERAEDRVRSLARIARPGQVRERIDGGDARDGGGRAEAAFAQECDRFVVWAVAELQLPEPCRSARPSKYARMSSAKVAASVLTCDTERAR